MLFKKITAAILLLAFLSLAIPQPTRAGAWGEPMRATIMEITWTRMLETIEKTMVANLRIMAIRVIQGRLQVLLTGSCGAYCIGGGSSGFITDWQDYIFGSAQRTAENTVNTFFNGMRSGVGSGMERVVNNAQKRFELEVLETKKPDLQNHVDEGKVEFIFDPTKSVSNRMIAFRKSNEPQNDEGAIMFQAGGIYAEAYRRQEELRKTKADSGQGFKSTEKKSSSSSYAAGKYGPGGTGTENEDYESVSEDGITTFPAIVLKDATSEIVNIWTKLLETAQTIPDIAANMAAQTLTNLVNYGIRQVTDPIDKAITDTRNKVGTSISNAQSQIQQGARDSLYFNKKQ